MHRLLPLVLLLLLAACQPPATPPPAFPSGTLVDLTYAYDSTTVYWPTAEGFQLRIDAQGYQEAGFYYEANSFFSAEHGGTHLDAPIHFSEGQHAADEIPLDRLIGEAVVVDVSEAALADRDYLVSQADIEAWEQAQGTTVDDKIVLLRTGYGQFWPDRERYMGTAERGADAVALLHFPGLDPAAAQWLVDNRTIKAIGLDTPSIDYGQSSTFDSHVILFGANIPAFENVANLDALPATGFYVMALPMKIADGSGGPLRIVALLP